MKFTLTIELGNDAMKTYDDIASALIQLGKECLDGEVPDDVADANNNGHVYDANGNRVGYWQVAS